MALMGVLWVLYLAIHSVSSLSYFFGAPLFNAVYEWFNAGIFWRFVVPTLLVLSLAYHIVVAITKQLHNLGKQSKYHKSYPKAIPRVIPWAGVSLVVVFIIVHIIQMWNISLANAYVEINTLFQNEFIVMGYILATITILFHIHHGLHNVSQTFARRTQAPVVLALIAIGSGFVSIPLYSYFTF